MNMEKIYLRKKAIDNNDEWVMDFELSNGLGFVDNVRVKDLINVLEDMPRETMIRGIRIAEVPGTQTNEVRMWFKLFPKASPITGGIINRATKRPFSSREEIGL